MKVELAFETGDGPSLRAVARISSSETSPLVLHGSWTNSSEDALRGLVTEMGQRYARQTQLSKDLTRVRDEFANKLADAAVILKDALDEADELRDEVTQLRQLRDSTDAVSSKDYKDLVHQAGDLMRTNASLTGQLASVRDLLQQAVEAAQPG